MRKAGVAHSKSSKDMESHVFLKAKTRVSLGQRGGQVPGRGAGRPPAAGCCSASVGQLWEGSVWAPRPACWHPVRAQLP